tara:strand:+ start:4822 stop:5292 length:471 start_codon:yes stop_codon:yes gene_type:complete
VALINERLNTEDVHLVLRSGPDLQGLFKMLNEFEFDFPLDVQIKKARNDRTLLQNRTQWQHYRDAARQGDQTAEEYKCYCKLRFGVPILRRDSEAYREKYDRIIKPLGYEKKLELMATPFDFPVTSAMSVRQHSEFLEKTANHFIGLGFTLTDTQG